ncbi:MAG: hypothetical protein LWX55_12385 [Deltaproteobacteria bacterium]|jgi:hypothetical protein|nr:hypothetical protein [Deltaproteobacteria bacterium]
MQNPANTALTLFCPRKSCKYYQSTENVIAKDGIYTTKSDSEPRQMFGSPYKTVQVNNFNQLHIMVSGSTW